MTSKEPDKDLREYDLTDVESKEKLKNETLTTDYFQPQEDVPYKIKIMSPKIKAFEKEIDGNIVTKYKAEIEAKSKDGEAYKGTWEFGKIIAQQLAKNYVNEKTVFHLTRTGTGLKTKYNITVDF